MSRQRALRRPSDGPGKEFLRATATWIGILLLPPVLIQLLSGSPLRGGWTLWELAYLLSGWVGLFLPYAAFAGGMAVGQRISPWHTTRFAVVAGLVSFLCLGYVSPWMEYQAELGKGLTVETRYPTGPETVGNLRALRALAEKSGPEEFRYSVEDPLRLPPNWITYLIHRPAAAAVFAILAALLGQIAAFLTGCLDPPLRRNARWGVGLGIGGLAFLAQVFGGDWVRLDPSHSGLIGAWVPLLPHAILFAALEVSILRNSGPSRISGPAASDV